MPGTGCEHGKGAIPFGAKNRAVLQNGVPAADQCRGGVDAVDRPPREEVVTDLALRIGQSCLVGLVVLAFGPLSACTGDQGCPRSPAPGSPPTAEGLYIPPDVKGFQASQILREYYARHMPPGEETRSTPARKWLRGVLSRRGIGTEAARP